MLKVCACVQGCVPVVARDKFESSYTSNRTQSWGLTSPSQEASVDVPFSANLCHAVAPHHQFIWQAAACAWWAASCMCLWLKAVFDGSCGNPRVGATHPAKGRPTGRQAARVCLSQGATGHKLPHKHRTPSALIWATPYAHLHAHTHAHACARVHRGG